MLERIINLMHDREGSSGLVPPSIRAVGAGNTGIAGVVDPALIDKPAGTAQNDILVLLTESSALCPVVAPAGWFDLGVPTGNGASQLGVFWKRATNVEPANYAVAVPAGANHVHAIIIAVKDCITTGNPWNATASQTNVGGGGTTSCTIFGTTTTVNNCLVLVAATGNSGTPTAAFSAWTNANLASVTEYVDLDGSTIVRHLGAAAGVLVAAGPTGDTTYTFFNTSSFGGQFCGALMGV